MLSSLPAARGRRQGVAITSRLAAILPPTGLNALPTCSTTASRACLVQDPETAPAISREWVDIKEHILAPLLRALDAGAGSVAPTRAPVVTSPGTTAAPSGASVEQILASLGYRTDDFTRAVRDFQSDARLGVTGTMDATTEGKLRALGGRLNAAGARPGAMRRMSRFRLTSYYVADERGYEMNPIIPVLDKNGKILARVNPAFFLSMSVEGTGRARSGQLLNVSGDRQSVRSYPEYQRLLDVARENPARLKPDRIDARRALRDGKSTECRVHEVEGKAGVARHARGLPTRPSERAAT